MIKIVRNVERLTHSAVTQEPSNYRNTMRYM